MVSEAKLRRSQEVAAIEISLFEASYGSEVLDFACHAAFPLTLTTELVYLLRQEYFPDLDWSVAPELLLSNLCQGVGYDLYEMPRRGFLLERLVDKFEDSRVNELAQWMGQYIQYRLAMEPTQRAKVLGEPSHWIALACLRDSDSLTQTIKDDLAKILAETDDASERFRLSALVESLGDLLAQRGLSPLKLQDLAGRIARSQPLDPALDEIERIRLAMEQAGFPPLKSTEINYATLQLANLVDVGDRLQDFEFETVTVDARGQEIQRKQHTAKYFIETLPEGLKLRLGSALTPIAAEVLNLEMVAIPSGKFWMGSPESEHERYEDEGKRHQVTLNPFFLGKYPITQAQWRKVASLPQEQRPLELEPAYFKGDNLPVEQVSWLDAEEFCLRLSAATGRTYRLPSEAQWEYACRAGTTTPFYFGETITGELANYYSSSTYRQERKVKARGRTTPVGQFPPNKFGLYDLHGNVWEWCQDHWCEHYGLAPTDGSAWLSDDENHSRILRGGSWSNNPRNCRSAYRNDTSPDYRHDDIGFRVMCVAPGTQP